MNLMMTIVWGGVRQQDELIIIIIIISISIVVTVVVIFTVADVIKCCAMRSSYGLSSGLKSDFGGHDLQHYQNLYATDLHDRSHSASALIVVNLCVHFCDLVEA
jgi:hypothetical protein